MQHSRTTDTTFGMVSTRFVVAGSVVSATGGDYRQRSMPTLFTRIIEGEIPGTFVWRDDACVAFLSINPITTGHTLVVPRVELDHWVDLDNQTLSRLMSVSHIIGQAQQQVFDCARVGLIIAGFEVPHVHVHVLPTNTMADLDFANAHDADPGELAAAADRLRDALGAGGHEAADR